MLKTKVMLASLLIYRNDVQNITDCFGYAVLEWRGEGGIAIEQMQFTPTPCNATIAIGTTTMHHL